LFNSSRDSGSYSTSKYKKSEGFKGEEYTLTDENYYLIYDMENIMKWLNWTEREIMFDDYIDP